MTTEPTVFQKIIRREIPARIDHEDDRCIAIHDMNPQAPLHLLIIPKKPISRIGQAQEEDCQTLGHLLLTAGALARKHGLADGYRVVINNGPHGGETVPHLHVHLLGGRPMTWPPG